MKGTPIQPIRSPYLLQVGGVLDSQDKCQTVGANYYTSNEMLSIFELHMGIKITQKQGILYCHNM